MTQQHQLQDDISSNNKTPRLSNNSITQNQEEQMHLERMAWLLEQEETGAVVSRQPSYGDVTTLNTDRTILDNVGQELLSQMSSDVLALLDTSLAVYEKNGEYAFGSFVSEWCWFMDNTSRELCHTDDNRQALRCGRWHCHENCWNESAKPAIESGKPTDIACVGGIRLYAVPIYANDDVIGAINIGYGTPPTDEATLVALSRKFGCDVEVLREIALSSKPRPPFLIEIAKKRLHSIALQIGKTVEAARNATLLKAAEKRNRSLLDYSPVCHKVVDLDSNLRYMNKMGFAMLKLEESNDYYGELYPFDFFPQEHREVLTKALQQVKNTNKRVVLEGLACDSEGGDVWLFHNLIPVPNDDGSLDYITVVSSDITERKRAEDQIKRALADKETLLRELYHRTKNNMQVIIALLDWQTEYVQDTQMRNILLETQHRIHSMALVHQKLYQSQNLSSINLQEYIRDLATWLLQSYQVTPGQVNITWAMEDVFVLIDTAIPCGLIVNELISNALQHAFPPGHSGEIALHLQRMPDEEIVLRISDDGVGLPPGFDIQEQGRLGLQTIIALGETQLQGDVTFTEDTGVTCTLRFKDDLYTKRV